MIAYCFRNGEIHFGSVAPEGSLVISVCDRHCLLEKDWQKVIVGFARRAYDGVMLLVPGVPEAESDEAALAALHRFVDILAARLPRNGVANEPGEG